MHDDERAARIEGYHFDLRAKVEDLARQVGELANGWAAVEIFRCAYRPDLVVEQPHRLDLPDELMDEVWGDDYHAVSRSLDVHIAHLRRKLEDDPASPRYLHTVRGVGYRVAA